MLERVYLQTYCLSPCTWRDYCRSVLQSPASHVHLYTKKINVKKKRLHTEIMSIWRETDKDISLTLNFGQDGKITTREMLATIQKRSKYITKEYNLKTVLLRPLHIECHDYGLWCCPFT